jgi:hypothetical protein
VSALGKAYLLVSLSLLLLGLVWAVTNLQENTAWVPISLWLPAWGGPEFPGEGLIAPASDVSAAPAGWGLWQARHYQFSASALLAGWMTTFVFMAVYAIRAPFRIRAAAVAQRRLRALEREVLELRTLPLRQAEEDDMLAAEARLAVAPQRAMLGHLIGRAPAPAEPGRPDRADRPDHSGRPGAPGGPA